MKDSTKKNLPLIIGLCIPVVMIIAVALAIYLPRVFAPKPQYGFLYLSGNTDMYNSQYIYSVSSGHLTRTLNTYNYPNPPKPVNFTEPQPYLYDAKTGQSKAVSFEVAQNITLDPSDKSPDGYQVVTGNSGGGFLFYSAPYDYNNRYLKGHGMSKKLDLQSFGNINYYYNFQFLGWKINN